MVSKISLPGFLSTTVLTAAVLVATIAPSSACPFSQKSSFLKGTESTSPTNLTSNWANLNQSDIHKLGIAGLAAILGLLGGGIMLKTTLAKRDQVLTDRSTAEGFVEYPIFPIEVPADALRCVDDAEVADAKSGSVR